ncbi:MAG TPA: hypothetical protein OIM48_02080 [Clostridiaceae bacterium]|nr:hypothetical protein [Clostridium sp.]HJJ12083.1 hypothetical protein [Clostridiaceae bacterium]
MMKKTRRVLKNIVVSFLIFYIIIANTSSSFARNFDDGAREFLSTQSEQFINQYAAISVYSTEPVHVPAHFDENKSTFYCCCTTGVAYMYQIFLGIDIHTLRI